MSSDKYEIGDTVTLEFKVVAASPSNICVEYSSGNFWASRSDVKSSKPRKFEAGDRVSYDSVMSVHPDLKDGEILATYGDLAWVKFTGRDLPSAYLLLNLVRYHDQGQ